MLGLMNSCDLSDYLLNVHIYFGRHLPERDFLLNTLKQNIKNACKRLVLILNLTTKFGMDWCSSFAPKTK